MELAKDDTLIAPMQKPGYVAESERDLTVVLDTNLDDALIEEGFVREVISKLQTMRKETDFEVTDRISVTVETGEKLAAIVARGAETIKAAVLATELTLGKAPEGVEAKEWNINGEKAVLSVRKNG